MISYGCLINFIEAPWDRYSMISYGFVRDFKGAVWER
jgi:hypothetical protein